MLRRLHDINDPDSQVRVSSEQEQQLRAVMLQRDPLLVRILLGAALGALPKSRVDDIAAVFYDMLYVSSCSKLACSAMSACFALVSWSDRLLTVGLDTSCGTTDGLPQCKTDGFAELSTFGSKAWYIEQQSNASHGCTTAQHVHAG